MSFVVTPSPRHGKKYRVTAPGGRTVDFGARGYEDYTTHQDPARRDRYVARHAARENWTAAGVGTAGFWSRWLLWEETTLAAAASGIQRRFGFVVLLN